MLEAFFGGCICIQKSSERATLFNFGKHFHPVHKAKDKKKTREVFYCAARIRKYFHGQVIIIPIELEEKKNYPYCCNV